MKAIVYRRFGSPDVLEFEELEKPVPGENQVVIKVRAASLNPLDWKMMKGGPFPIGLLLGLGQPKLKRPGVDVAGEVEAVGRNVATLKPGDQMFGTCVGAFAEYAISTSATGMKSVLVKKPDQVSFEEAASAPVAALTALQGLRDKGRLQSGQSVLINGAAGGVGTFAVQIARSMGAGVTAVCSAGNADMVRSIGADKVIDYKQQDFTRTGQRYDVVLDCVGNRSLQALQRVLMPHGILVMVGAAPDASMFALLARLVAARVMSCFLRQELKFFIAKVNEPDLTTIAELLASGKVMPVIDRRYRLSEAREAFRYAQKGHVRGKVILTPDNRL
jgi:NADPH:quinone reductase-like Zn-dependent oxidoreductase